MKNNSKKVALVTGASAGMGKNFCLRLIREGFTVYGAARRTALMADIAAAGGHILAMDVTDEESMVRGVGELLRNEGRIDVLVNNAGYGAYGAIEDVPLSEARRQFEVNLFGVARLTQLVLPTMRAQRSGYILNISSVGGKVYSPLGGWYHATKHALEGFSDCLRFETRAFGVKVVVIEPGGVESEWAGIAANSAEQYSGKSAYAGIAAGWGKLVRKVKGAKPAVISDLVMKAVRSKNPRTRYVGGAASHLSLFLRAVLTDKLFDRVLGLLVG